MKQTLCWNILLWWGTWYLLLQFFSSTLVFSLPLRIVLVPRALQMRTHISTALRSQRPGAWFINPSNTQTPQRNVPVALLPSWKQSSQLEMIMKTTQSVFQLDTLEFDDTTTTSFGHLSFILYPRSYPKNASRLPSCDTQQHVCLIHFI